MVVDVKSRTPFIDFVREQMLPPGVTNESIEAARLMRHSKNYVLIDDQLYKVGAGARVLMKCVSTEDGKAILNVIHDGTCGNHATSRTLVG